MAKKDFFVELPRIVEAYGTTISRPDLKKYCQDNNVSIPALIRQHRVGRGMFDLTGMIEAGKQIYNGSPVAGSMSSNIAPEPVVERTDEEIEDDISSRFASLDLMTYGIVEGNFRSMIVSGNAGIGKTYTLEYILETARDSGKIRFESVRGYVRATGLYRLLWANSSKGQVLMFDDADSVFGDETGLNLLKGALDTTKRRTISWRSEKKFEMADGEMIPDSFDFNGSIVFVSNINFQRAVQSQNKLSPHLEALMSRSYYLDLNLTSVRELLVRIRSVVKHSDILSSMEIKKRDQTRIVDYIEDNAPRLREMSLRTVIKLGTIWQAAKGDEINFKKMADATSLVRGR